MKQEILTKVKKSTDHQIEIEELKKQIEFLQAKNRDTNELLNSLLYSSGLMAEANLTMADTLHKIITDQNKTLQASISKNILSWIPGEQKDKDSEFPVLQVTCKRSKLKVIK